MNREQLFPCFGSDSFFFVNDIKHTKSIIYMSYFLQNVVYLVNRKTNQSLWNKNVNNEIFLWT
jgi:hypothetical protein